MKMIINGKSAASSDKKVFDNINPTTGEVICTIPLASDKDLESAAVFAKKAQEAWAEMPFFERAQIIKNFISLVNENFEEIAKVMCQEGGKLIGECRGELSCLCVIFESYTEAAHHLYGSSVPLNAEPRTLNDVIFTIKEPLGVFVTITPYNFPVELYAHKVAPALVTGNTVIVKPSSNTPMSAIMLTEILVKAGVPDGVIQIVTSGGRVFGKWLEETKNVDAVSFTGSTPVGIELMRGGAKHLKRMFLELGGNDPFVVFDDCDMDLAIAETIGGRCYNAGQTCCANKRFIVHNSIKEEFTKRLVDGLTKMKMGDPMDESTQIGPLVSDNAAMQVVEQIEFTVKQGAKCIYGGERNGAFIVPAVLADVTKDMDIAKDLEVFGPVFPIIGFDTFEEAVLISNSTIYGLASGVITSNMKTAMKFAKSIKAGTCVINGSGNYRSVHQPFGGYKHSGIGREGLLQTLDEFTQEKSIVLKQILG